MELLKQRLANGHIGRGKLQRSVPPVEIEILPAEAYVLLPSGLEAPSDCVGTPMFDPFVGWDWPNRLVSFFLRV